MSNLAITSAPLLTGVNTASGDLFPLVDVSASAGSKGSAITRDELGDAMTRTAAMIAALAAKLDKAGGTMTGVLTLTNGTASACALNFGDADTGLYTSAATSSLDFAVAGSRMLQLNTTGIRLANDTKDTIWRRTDIDFLFLNSGQSTSGIAIGAAGYLPGVNFGSASSLRWTNDTPASSPDLILSRAASACLQLGVTHATTATAQTIKAHNVTTGTGANLVLAGGTGSVMGGSVKIAASTTTGAPNTLIEVMPSDQLAFFGTGGSTQPNTGIAGESHVVGLNTAVTEDSTFGGYTLMQVVAGLRALGLFQ